MGRYSFIGSHQNFSDGQVRGALSGYGFKGINTGNMFADIQGMRNFGYAKQQSLGHFQRSSQRNLGYLSGAGFWFKR